MCLYFRFNGLWYTAHLNTSTGPQSIFDTTDTDFGFPGLFVTPLPGLQSIQQSDQERSATELGLGLCH